MKKLSLLFISVLMGGMLQAQQLPQLTQFMINDYAVNPAIAGMNDFYQIKTSVRNQWVGINDAPKTTLLSIYGKNSEHVGLGGSVFNDQVGPTSRIGASMTYAYHLNLTKKMKLSLALSGGFTQFKVDLQDLSFEDDENLDANFVDLVPDATFGMNIYNDDWYIGVAIPQLLNNKVNIYDIDTVEFNGSLFRQINVLGAYKLSVSNYWDLQPSILYKSVSSQSQLDIGLKTIYNDMFWLGMDYRNNGDMAALLGITIQDKYLIGYSYDILNADLSDFSAGSHEFMFGITFNPSTENQIRR